MFVGERITCKQDVNSYFGWLCIKGKTYTILESSKFDKKFCIMTDYGIKLFLSESVYNTHFYKRKDKIKRCLK